jgi:acyl-CoA thioesterase FadM
MRYDFRIQRKSDDQLRRSGYLKIIAVDLGTWKATELPSDLTAKVTNTLK